jgi:DNA uptake protein ComE-like DNA-binding protein
MSSELSPEAVARLNDKKWRRSQSKWMLWIYLTSSSLGVIGFARIAIKTKNPVAKKYTYILSGILFVLFTLIALDNPTETVVDGKTVTDSGTLGTIGGLLVFVNYGLQVFLSFKVNKIWLVHKAQDNNPDWVQQNITVKGVAQTLMQSPQDLVKDALGIDRSEYLAENTQSPAQPSKKTPPPPPPPKNSPPPPPSVKATSGSKPQQLLNLNAATVEELIQVAGLDPVLAANTIVQREKSQGFSSFDSFATTMQLQPHQIAKLKPIFVVVDKPGGQQDDKPGRVLDI